jgi:hypothetical protein
MEKGKCSFHYGVARTCCGRMDRRRDAERHSVIPTKPSVLEFELERACAPLADVTVEHGALCEGHVP